MARELAGARRRSSRRRRGAAAAALVAATAALQAFLTLSAFPRSFAWLPVVGDRVSGHEVRDADVSKLGALAEPLGDAGTAADRAEGLGSRRAALAACSAACLAAAVAWGSAARALVKGNAPPTGYGVGRNLTESAKCKVKEECQEIGRKKEDEVFSQSVKYQMTPSGARYYDMVPGSKEAGVISEGSVARLKYRVMRQGKRSQDGLSGEASTIFSLGYGEDEGPKDAVLTAPVGSGKFVKALDEGLVGMAVGAKRRVQVRPENGLGWNKEGKCAEAVQAVGVLAGVPASGAQNEETCIDTSKLPQPVDFASKRRFSRRFDESLIVEVELIGLGPA